MAEASQSLTPFLPLLGLTSSLALLCVLKDTQNQGKLWVRWHCKCCAFLLIPNFLPGWMVGAAYLPTCLLPSFSFLLTCGQAWPQSFHWCLLLSPTYAKGSSDSHSCREDAKAGLTQTQVGLPLFSNRFSNRRPWCHSTHPPTLQSSTR